MDPWLRARDPRGTPSILGGLIGGSFAWLAAFLVGNVRGALYAWLVPAALLLAGACLVAVPAARRSWAVPEQRVLAADLALGAAVGLASLAATHALFPVAVGLWPPLAADLDGLYTLAAITPATLALSLIVVLCEEVIWRGTLLPVIANALAPTGLLRLVAVPLAALPYALAQGGARSLVLVGAAFAFGCLWGALCIWRGGRVHSALVAHALWTPLILGPLPLG